MLLNQSDQNFFLLHGSCALIALSLGLILRGLSSVKPLPLPEGGLRGKHRRRALKASPWRAVDPPLRQVSAWLELAISRLSRFSPSLRKAMESLNTSVDHFLARAGEPGGLCPGEVYALSALLSVAGALLGGHFGSESRVVWTCVGFFVGAGLPWIRIRSLALERLTVLGRELPGAIDLTALSMSAGSDFPSALKKVAEGQTGVVAEEFRQVLFSLELGMTRRAALLALEKRAPVSEVSDLVKAIILAEQKGASVADALVAQARTSRQRRSVRAEESAAQAGVLLIGPLMLLVGCILILLVGPLIMASSAL